MILGLLSLIERDLLDVMCYAQYHGDVVYNAEAGDLNDL